MVMDCLVTFWKVLVDAYTQHPRQHYPLYQQYFRFYKDEVGKGECCCGKLTDEPTFPISEEEKEIGGCSCT